MLCCVDVVGVASGGRVSVDHQRVYDGVEGDGAFSRGFQSVSGLTAAADPPRIFDRNLDGLT